MGSAFLESVHTERYIPEHMFVSTGIAASTEQGVHAWT
jgi:hypothetical protein